MKTIVDAVHDTVNVVLVGAVAVAVIASVLLWNGPTRARARDVDAARPRHALVVDE